MNDDGISDYTFLSSLPNTREELTAWILANSGNTGYSLAKQEIVRAFPPDGDLHVMRYRRGQYFKEIERYIEHWARTIERKMPDIPVAFEIEPEASAVGYYTEIFVAGIKVL